MILALTEQSTPRPAPSRARHTSALALCGFVGVVACVLSLCATPTFAQTGPQRIRLIPSQGRAGGATLQRATPAAPSIQSAPNAATVVAKQPEAPKVLDPSLGARVAELLDVAAAEGVTLAVSAERIEAASGGLYADCSRAHGDLALLDTHLAEVIAASEGAREQSA